MNIKKMEVSFWRHKSKQSGKAQLYCRISIGNQRQDIGSTGLTIAFDHWTGDYVTDDDPEAYFKNEHLDTLRNQLRAIFNDLFRRKETITAAKIKRLYLGNTVSTSLLSVFELYLADCRADRERDLAPGSIGVYERARQQLLMFLTERRARDLLAEDFDLTWMKAYRNWLSTVRIERPKRSIVRTGYAESYIVKLVETLRNVLKWAKLNRLTPTNPLEGYRIKAAKYGDPDFLTPSEFEALRRHHFDNPFMQEVADVFIILCRTGFHYGDLMDFLRRHDTVLRRGIDGGIWLIKDRIKTDVGIRVPQFEEVAEIVAKYGGWGKLPTYHLTSFNRWLKLVAGEMKFHPKLSSKAGRKTFTDWCFNTLNLTTDSVLTMLGRKSAQGLEVYGRPDERRVAAELRGSKEMQERKKRKAS